MSTRQAKQARRATRKLKAEIKIEALREFMEYAARQGFWKRLRFAVRIIMRAV